MHTFMYSFLSQKQNIKVVYTDIQKASFFQSTETMLNKLPQDVVSCEMVEHCQLKLKRFNLNSINNSKVQ